MSSAPQQPEKAFTQEERNDSANIQPPPSDKDTTLIKELINAGVPLSRVSELFHDRISERDVTRIARDVITEATSAAAAEAISSGGTISNNKILPSFLPELGMSILSRSSSARTDTHFLRNHAANLTSCEDAPEEMIDPLFFTLMMDPVVLSSGYVMDRSTVVAEEDGAGSKLKFHTCPFTRVPLEQSVYPLIYLRRKIFEFKQAKIETMMETARVLLDRGGDSLKNFWEVIDKCESFIDEIGDTTYIHLASRLASLSLEAYDAQNENEKCEIVLVTPTRLATILGRLYRGCPSLQKACNDDGKGESEGDIGEALDDETKANYENFRKRVADLVVCANNSIDDKKFDEAALWIEACEMVYSSCSNLNMITLLSVAKLHLKLAKARDDTDLLPLRRRVYMEMTISDPDGVARFCDEEGLSIDDLRDLRPIVLYKESIRAVTNDDVWHSAIRSGGLEGEVAAVMVHAGTFEDQGWGNEKGNLGLALYDNEGGLVTRCNLFGTYRASGYSYGNHPARILHAEDDIVSKARPGFQYALEFTVGGGGGHRLNVKAWYCKIFFVNSSFDASRIGTYYMTDPEGDDGLYVGQLDANGKSDGKGELVYYDKDIFVGKFEYGSMVEGVLYNGTRALDTMVNGRWTYNNFENGMVERYPYDVVLSADC